MVRSFGQVEVGSSEFPVPQIKNGTYGGQVILVSDGTGSYEGEEYDLWMVDWELEANDAATGEPVQLRQWVSVPKGLHKGILDERSALYELLLAIGEDMEHPRVEPDEWIGRTALINVQNETMKGGKAKGQVRPRIKGVMAFPIIAEKQANPTPLRKRLEPVAAEEPDTTEYPWVGTLNALCDANEIGYPAIAKVLGFKKPVTEEILLDAIDARITANPNRKAAAVIGELVGKAAALEE